jgi:hypothetical protein
MNIHIRKLPQDVVDYIIPYTYQLQNKPLLEDIKNFNETKKIVLELYYNYWIVYFNEEVHEDKYWLINDLIAFFNNYEATMYGYTEKFYNIFRRNQSLQSCETINNYVNLLEDKQVDSQINILWALLTPKERSDIIVSMQESNQFLI